MAMAGGDATMTRDLQALRRFEAFLFTAIATVLLVRVLLVVTGYPQVGGGELHVAHVLWGGLLMGVAMVVAEVLPGSRWRIRAAYLGGIGFGLFLDEVGKFVTKDVNYFFQPAVAIIYAVFVLFYLGVREVLLGRPQSDAHRLAVASTALTDLALGQLDDRERNYALRLLDGVGGNPVLCATVRAGLKEGAPSGPAHELWLTALRDRIGARAVRAVAHPGFGRTLVVVFVVQVAVLAGELIEIVLQPDIGRSRGSTVSDLAAGISTTISTAYLCFGLFRLVRGNRAGAIRVLYRSVIVTLMFTQLLVFARYQWSGLLGFGLELLVLSALHLATAVEREAGSQGARGGVLHPG